MFAKFYNSPDGIKSNAELFIFATENLVSLEFIWLLFRYTCQSLEREDYGSTVS